ncbi:hypothetical protein SELMODRAFT_439878 [Selaginella moellendorffii]|uniref:SET domain-containing protein n=1 Tax=Selaginella moellendorffii TaxID=88036 RepID=D8R7Z6_SELML|nr:hypothetical protein SELMODRAFT_439878 [Selaginella moellendorffii]
MEDSRPVEVATPASSDSTGALLQNLEISGQEKQQQQPDEAEAKNRRSKNKSKKKKKNFVLEPSFPWKVATVKNRGRCAVATRAIKAGEVVVAEQAIAFVPRGQYRKAICHVCGVNVAENGPKFECSACNYTIFCEECYKPPQGSHENYCAVYREIASIARDENCDADLLRLVFNLALKKAGTAQARSSLLQLELLIETLPFQNSKDETCTVDGVIHSCFKDALGLETHRSKAPSSWLEAVRNGCTRLHKIACVGNGGKPAPVSCSIEELEMLATLINTNSHGMGAQNLQNTHVALGLFPYVSILNHSCRPNCCFASEGSVMYVRAVQDIPKGAELCLSYINLYESRRVRKTLLVATKHFDCTCDRCVEPLNTSIDRFLEGCVCHVRGCGGVFLRTAALHEDQASSTTWECDLCSRILDPESMRFKDPPWEVIAKAEERLVAAVRIYSERRFKEARKLLESYLSEFTGKLHPLHVFLFDALTPLMNCCRAMGDAEEGLRVCRLILQCMEKVLPGPSLELANFYFCLGEMYLEKAQASSPVIAKRSNKQASYLKFNHFKMQRASFGLIGGKLPEVQDFKLRADMLRIRSMQVENIVGGKALVFECQLSFEIACTAF